MNRKDVEDFLLYCMNQDDVPVDDYTTNDDNQWFKDGDEWFPVHLILNSEFYTQWKETLRERK